MDVWDYHELQKEVLSHFNNEIEPHSTCHVCVDEFYKVMPGSCTDITGYPYSGKTLFLIEILYGLSKSKGLKHLLHLPDSGKPAEVIANLIEKETSKSFNKKHANAIKEHEIIKEFAWIYEHFKILRCKPKSRPNPIEFWQKVNSMDVDTGSIDSWNYMRHDGSGTEYLAQTLSARNEMAEESGKHFFTVIHPKNPTAQDYDSNGRLKAPDVFNLMGGSEWNNNGKSIISIHKEIKEGDDYDIYIRKTKPRAVGKTGFTTLKYDMIKRKFYSIANGFNEYADYLGENGNNDFMSDAEEIIF